MGRLVLIILVLFSVTAIYSEAHAGGQRNQAQETTGSPQWRNAGPGCPEARPLLRDRARLNG
ncbi:MAG: hypothetical protein ACLFQT_03275 [Thiohalophilus sp.]